MKPVLESRLNYHKAQKSILLTSKNKAAQNIKPFNSTGRLKKMKECEKRM